MLVTSDYHCRASRPSSSIVDYLRVLGYPNWDVKTERAYHIVYLSVAQTEVITLIIISNSYSARLIKPISGANETRNQQGR
jgi:hypothetical protein